MLRSRPALGLGRGFKEKVCRDLLLSKVFAVQKGNKRARQQKRDRRGSLQLRRLTGDSVFRLRHPVARPLDRVVQFPVVRVVCDPSRALARSTR